MRIVYWDSSYLIARALPGDRYHSSAVKAMDGCGDAQFMTSDEVLAEFLNFFCARGSFLRAAAIQAVKAIIRDPRVTVIPQSRESFSKGLELYAKRKDKQYSLIDCISMSHMKTKCITEVLTTDHHFIQAGFKVLMA